LTVDGYFAGPNGEIDWFKEIEKDDEWDKYTHQQAQSSQTTLIFGHKTYEMMKSWWPTQSAIETDPSMVEVMNNSPKIVISKTLESVEEGPNWKNIRLFRDIKPGKIRELKEKENMLIMGSGTIVQQFANLDLIDEYNLVVVPLILGSGKLLFKDIKKMKLKLLESRSFKNGIVLLRYKK
jgi:dihydrofolate reductase